MLGSAGISMAHGSRGASRARSTTVRDLLLASVRVGHDVTDQIDVLLLVLRTEIGACDRGIADYADGVRVSRS